jgi:hypothetical protein
MGESVLSGVDRWLRGPLDKPPTIRKLFPENSWITFGLKYDQQRQVLTYLRPFDSDIHSHA